MNQLEENASMPKDISFLTGTIWLYNLIHNMYIRLLSQFLIFKVHKKSLPNQSSFSSQDHSVSPTNPDTGNVIEYICRRYFERIEYIYTFNTLYFQNRN